MDCCLRKMPGCPSSSSFCACTPDATSSARMRSFWIAMSKLISSVATVLSVGRSCLCRRQHVQHFADVASLYLYAPAGPYDSSRNLSLTSLSRAAPIDGFSVTDSKDRFFCGHGGCSKTFTRAAGPLRVRLIWNAMPKCTRKGLQSTGVRPRDVRGMGQRGLRGRISWLII